MKDSKYHELVAEHNEPPPPPKPTPAKPRKSYGAPATTQQIVDKLLARGFTRTPQGSFSRR